MKDIPSIRQEDITSVPTKDGKWEIAGMDDRAKAQLVERLRELLDRPGAPTPRALSIAIGANTSYVSQILNGKGGTPSSARLRAIAEQLGTTTDYLSGLVSVPAQPISEVTFAPIPPLSSKKSTNPIRVLGTGLCDDLAITDEGGGVMRVERLLLDQDHAVRLIERPPSLYDAPDAYAIYFQGSSMEPRFYQGEIGIVDPRRPPSPGDFVVVQLTDGTNDHVITVLVKQLVKVNGATVWLRQFNPAMEFHVPRGEVARLHRICSPTELLGG